MTWFEIFAHLGAPIDAPENTLPAFEKAVALGAEAVELDVRLTKDHVPLLDSAVSVVHLQRR